MVHEVVGELGICVSESEGDLYVIDCLDGTRSLMLQNMVDFFLNRLVKFTVKYDETGWPEKVELEHYVGEL